ncbi:cytochrome P450 [Aspergillus sclerotiicarbonarius CBS 121057]|uniref:Cytochrome P450 n=1 Tax=Aspergillus sclerotiicarbonarius (strain CBS 121057 / IBT 28362) TaxID=1448318 RepID=A0A319DUZ6_ASPSB|nr:cytochrome P450 [Aspergillus sclerotiicarbonarius CBS 121057]
MSAASAFGIITFSIIGVCIWMRITGSKLNHPDHPPVVTLSDHDLFERPLESYTRALEQNGPVIAVKRKGLMEIIIAEKFAAQVITDDANFSFEQGTAKILNIQFVQRMSGGMFLKKVDNMINELVTRRLDSLISQISPIFQRKASELENSASPEMPLDLHKYAKDGLAEATLLAVFGRGFISNSNLEIIIQTAEAIAELTGMYQNQSMFARSFPSAWRMATFVKIMLVRILFQFGTTMGLAIWSEMSRVLEHDNLNVVEKEDVSLLVLLVRRYRSRDGALSISSRLWIIALLISAVFASVHQTVTVMVWALFELALRPDSQDLIHKEIISMMGKDASNSKGLGIHPQVIRDANVTDSFIREAMRMKGDTLGLVRRTTKDVPLGGVVIPKGYPVFPIVSLSNRSPTYSGESANEFDGLRWVDNKPAAMSGPGFLTFGLGRWACPGRFLAIAEIKMLIFTFLMNIKVEVVGNSYTVIDKLNVTSVPPKGYLKLRRRD